MSHWTALIEEKIELTRLNLLESFDDWIKKKKLLRGDSYFQDRSPDNILSDFGEDNWNCIDTSHDEEG